jgi:hypothetical protein
MFLPVEPFEIGAMVVEGEIAQVIDQVLRRDPFVPAFDNGAIHLRDRLERPVRRGDDVFVTEVSVGREENRHRFNSI